MNLFAILIVTLALTCLINGDNYDYAVKALEYINENKPFQVETFGCGSGFCVTMNKGNYSNVLAFSSDMELCYDGIQANIPSCVYKVTTYFSDSIVSKGYKLQGPSGLMVERNKGFLFGSPSYSYYVFLHDNPPALWVCKFNYHFLSYLYCALIYA